MPDKKQLKDTHKQLQKGKCDFSGELLPKKIELFDIDRKLPKAQGGLCSFPNTRVGLPVPRMKCKGTYRERPPELSDLKIITDARRQILKSKIKISNQLLAYKRHTDTLDQETLDFLTNLESQLTTVLNKKDRSIIQFINAMNDELVSAALSVHAVGPITVAHCIVYINLEKARHASSVWSYVGLDKPSHQRYIKTKASGGNKTLRTVLYTMADSQIKHRGPYREMYDRVKARLEISDKIVKTRNTEGLWTECSWKDTKPCHRHGAGIRAIMKHFLADYWYVGRTLMGLDTSPCYAEAMLGKTHKTIAPEERGWVF